MVRAQAWNARTICRQPCEIMLCERALQMSRRCTAVLVRGAAFLPWPYPPLLKMAPCPCQARSDRAASAEAPQRANRRVGMLLVVEIIISRLRRARVRYVLYAGEPTSPSALSHTALSLLDMPRGVARESACCVSQGSLPAGVRR